MISPHYRKIKKQKIKKGPESHGPECGTGSGLLASNLGWDKSKRLVQPDLKVKFVLSMFRLGLSSGVLELDPTTGLIFKYVYMYNTLYVHYTVY